MSASSQLGDVFAAILPSRFKVVGEPRELDALQAREPVVVVIRTSLEPGNRARVRVNTFAVWVIQPKQFEGAEDALDDDLDEVLALIDGDERLLWTNAERSTYGRNDDGNDTYPAYRITLTLATSVQIKE